MKRRHTRDAMEDVERDGAPVDVPRVDPETPPRRCCESRGYDKVEVLQTFPVTVATIVPKRGAPKSFTTRCFF